MQARHGLDASRDPVPFGLSGVEADAESAIAFPLVRLETTPGAATSTGSTSRLPKATAGCAPPVGSGGRWPSLADYITGTEATREQGSLATDAPAVAAQRT